MLERFGEKLRVLREQRGLSQKQLAQQIDVARSHIVLLENGTRKNPGTKIVFAIADFFCVPVDVLVRDELDLDEG